MGKLSYKMNSSKRLVYNTGVVYGQLIINFIINLFVVRFVLNALGQTDYGIYTVVAGVISMLNVFTSSLSHASMRYIGHSLGTGDKELVRKTFNIAMKIHFAIAIGIVVVLEIGGWLMFEYFLNIPPDRISVAKIVYQFMVVSTYVTTIAIPYDGVISAHENLTFLAITSVSGTILQLGLAIWLMYSSLDLLILYGFGKMSIQILLRVVKQIYSTKHYEECKLRLKNYKDNVLTKSMLAFTGWELFAVLAHISTSHFRGLFINMFFGVKLNAGEGIGTKIKTELNMVSVGITHAITPQMNKSEGGGNRERLIHLTKTGIKYTTFMFALIAMPVFLETNYLLQIWLKNIPDYAVIFTQLAIIIQITDKLTWQVGNALKAVGRNKEIQLFQGISALVGLIVAFIGFKIGAKPESIYYVEIVVVVVNMTVRLILGKQILGINPWSFIKETALPVLIPLAISFAGAYYTRGLMEASFIRLVLVTLIFILLFSMMFAFGGMNKTERKSVNKVLLSFIKK